MLPYKSPMQINSLKIIRGCDKRNISNFNLCVIIVTVSKPSLFVFI